MYKEAPGHTCVQAQPPLRVLLVSAATPDTFWSYKHALRFISRKSAFPPLGLLTVAAMLPKEWNLRLIDLNVDRLTDADIDWADYVFVSAMLVQAPSARETIDRCTKRGKPLVAGGPLFTTGHAEYAEPVHLVLGEAEPLIDELVRDNCATRVLGRTSDGELSSGTYGRLPNGLAERIATLERGQALVWHPTFRTPQLVRFPRPAWQTGRPVGDERVRRTTMDTVGDLSDTARRRLTSGLSDQAVESIVADADDPDRARKALERARTIDPHDVHLVADRSNALDPDYPFDLG